MERITRQEFLERLFQDDYENLKGKTLRLTRVRVPGKEVTMAHIMNPMDVSIYQNLALHIGVHEGEDHRGEAIGIIQFTPWEATIAAADVASKASDVQIAFLDRFNGTLILTGRRDEVTTAVETVVNFFRDDLGFAACKVHTH